MSNMTERNTKKEILSQLKTTEKLLEEAKSQLSSEKSKFGIAPEEKLKAVQNKAILEKANQLDPEAIRDERLKITEFYSNIENKAKEVKEQLDTLNEALVINEAKLEEVHKIRVEADTLSALIRANAIEKEQFENEKKDLKDHWEKEISKIQEEYREKEEGYKKNLARNKEEWNYEFEQLKKKNVDDWEREKKIRLSELEEEENKVRAELKKAADEWTAKHDEFNEYKAKVEAFPDELAKVVEETKKKTTESLNRSKFFEVETLKKDHEINSKVLDQQVKDLTARNEDLVKQLAETRSELKEANIRSETIAKEAITGASKQKFVVNAGSDKEK